MDKEHLERFSQRAIQLLETLVDVPIEEREPLLDVASALAACHASFEHHTHLQAVEAAMAAAASNIGMALPQQMFDSLQSHSESGEMLVQPPPIVLGVTPQRRPQSKGTTAPDWAQEEMTDDEDGKSK